MLWVCRFRPGRTLCPDISRRDQRKIHLHPLPQFTPALEPRSCSSSIALVNLVVLAELKALDIKGCTIAFCPSVTLANLFILQPPASHCRTGARRINAECCKARNSSTVVYSGVACSAKRDQVFFRIIAGMAAKSFVVDLKIGNCAARLASPAIPAQHFVAEFLVEPGFQPQTLLFWSNPVHDAFSAKWSRNAFLSSPGRNLKNRKIDCSNT